MNVEYEELNEAAEMDPGDDATFLHVLFLLLDQFGLPFLYSSLIFINRVVLQVSLRRRKTIASNCQTWQACLQAAEFCSACRAVCFPHFRDSCP
jgi:hypothetical protein